MDLFRAEYGEFNELGEVVGKPCSVRISKTLPEARDE
jgi:hypothetical protein